MKQNWSFLQKVSFLFFFTYVFLFTFSHQFFFSSYFELLWQKVIPWFADVLGHTPAITTFSNGSGDTTYNYFQILFFAILSFLIALGVGLVDRKRDNYQILLSWLIVLIRYYIAFQMLAYGVGKMFGMQFSFPSEQRLSTELGDYSPMGLLWIFMGFSKSYSVFTGILEFVGGILLLSRYTTTLGALTTFGVMLNVMMMNYCYDVPVKILSTHLVLLSLFLISLDAPRLLKFFFTNQKTEALHFVEVIPAKYRKGVSIAKWILIVGAIGFSFVKMCQYKEEYKPKKDNALFHGSYYVEQFDRRSIAAEGEQSIKNNKEKWLAFEQQNKGTASIKTSLGHEYRFSFVPDTLNKKVRLKLNGKFEMQELDYERIDSSRIHLYGIYEADSLDVVLKKRTANDRNLVKRGFHWTNEYPFNQ